MEETNELLRHVNESFARISEEGTALSNQVFLKALARERERLKRGSGKCGRYSAKRITARHRKNKAARRARRRNRKNK